VSFFFFKAALDLNHIVMCGLVSQVESHLMLDPKGYKYYHFKTSGIKSGEVNISRTIHVFRLLQ
jgi:hypothetical protein